MSKPFVRTWMDGGKIVVSTHNMHWETGRDLCKAVPGGRWNKANSVWGYPLDLRIAKELRKQCTRFGADLQIHSELSAWARAEQSRLDAVPDVASMDLVELPKIRDNYPYMWEKMSERPFQTVGVAVSSESRTITLADDPGLGKTLQTLATMANCIDDGLILVVAPKSAATNVWPSQIKQWLGKKETVVNLSDLTAIPKGPKRDAFLEDAANTMDTAPGRVWVIIGEHWIRVKAYPDAQKKKFKRNPDGSIKMTKNLPLLFEFKWDAVIVDESHKVVICNTANRCRWTQARFGLSELALSPNPMRMALSGTPMRGKSENMWGTLNWLRPKFYTSYWKWMDKHFENYDNQDDPFGPAKVYGQLKDENEFYAEMKDLFIRRTKEEVAKDLPPKMYGGEPLDPEDPTSPVGVWLEMLPKQKKLYDQMVKHGETEDGIIANGTLAEWTRLKQFSNAVSTIADNGEIIPTFESNKLLWIEEFLDDRGILDGSGTSKVIISSQFAQFVNMIARWLDEKGVAYHKLIGGVSGQKRVKMNEEFQAPGGPQVFLMTTTAGGVALTLDAADDVVICDETWIPDDQLQVEDRAHRLSRTDHDVTIWYLRSRNSIEEAIARVTGGREDEVRGIMDRSRGVHIRKQILATNKKIGCLTWQCQSPR